MHGNILACFAMLDYRGNQTNQVNWLKLLHTSYISLLYQAGKGRSYIQLINVLKPEPTMQHFP